MTKQINKKILWIIEWNIYADQIRDAPGKSEIQNKKIIGHVWKVAWIQKKL